MGAQKNRLIETILLSTHNICFGREIRKNNFQLNTLIWLPVYAWAMYDIDYTSQIFAMGWHFNIYNESCHDYCITSGKIIHQNAKAKHTCLYIGNNDVWHLHIDTLIHNHHSMFPLVCGNNLGTHNMLQIESMTTNIYHWICQTNELHIK